MIGKYLKHPQFFPLIKFMWEGGWRFYETVKYVFPLWCNSSTRHCPKQGLLLRTSTERSFAIALKTYI